MSAASENEAEVTEVINKMNDLLPKVLGRGGGEVTEVPRSPPLGLDHHSGWKLSI